MPGDTPPATNQLATIAVLFTQADGTRWRLTPRTDGGVRATFTAVSNRGAIELRTPTAAAAIELLRSRYSLTVTADEFTVEREPDPTGEPHGRYQKLVSFAAACVVGWGGPNRPPMPEWARQLADGLRAAGCPVDEFPVGGDT